MRELRMQPDMRHHIATIDYVIGVLSGFLVSHLRLVFEPAA
jgi:hypothetical protein